MRVAVVLALCPLLVGVALPAQVPDRTFPRPPRAEVREAEGIEDRVHDGKLYLHLKDFIALVLKNNTEIYLTRLDVLTAADAILGAKAPFDPNVNAGSAAPDREHAAV